MRITNIIATFLIVLLTFASGDAVSGKKKVSIELIANSESEADTLSATAFGISLAGALSEKGDVSSESLGIYKPTFEILVTAFSSQIQIWRELKDKGDPGSNYMDQLILIDDMGFLNEYIWTVHVAETSNKLPAGLQLESFRDWFGRSVGEHAPRIEARLSIHE